MRYFYGATWKTKMKKIEGSGALERPQVKEIEASGALERPQVKEIEGSEALERQQVKEIEGSFRAGPSVQSSIRMSLQKWISLIVQTNGARRRRSRSSVARPSSEENRSEQLLQPGYYVCESGKTRMRILHQLGACWMVPGVDYFSFAHSRRSGPFSGDLHQGMQVVRLKGDHEGVG